MSAPVSAPVLLVLAGPAGSGKTTLCDRMVAETPGFSRIVTSTTRDPRPGEINGVHYHFLTDEQFDRKVAAGEFLEWARVHKASRRYGTLTSSVMDPLAAGKSLIINVDIQGVSSFREAAAVSPLLAKHLATIFIHVPIPVLRERMVARGQDSLEEIESRIRTAETELKAAAEFDYIIESSTKDADFSRLLALWREVAARVSASP